MDSPSSKDADSPKPDIVVTRTPLPFLHALRGRPNSSREKIRREPVEARKNAYDRHDPSYECARGGDAAVYGKLHADVL